MHSNFLLLEFLSLNGLFKSAFKFLRLHECVEVLKDMEMKGILDMTKVYAFFKLLLDITFIFIFSCTNFTGHRFTMQSFLTTASNERLLEKLLITSNLFQIQA